MEHDRPSLRTRVAARLSRVPGRRAPRPDTPGASSGASSGGEVASRDLDLLLGSELFDHTWYAALAGVAPEREAAARHYLRRGARRGLSPHPLIDGPLLSALVRGLPEDRSALVAYLTDPALHGSSVPHPLFETRRYLEAVPEARSHPGGVLVHYLRVGAPGGVSPNGWYVPRPDVEPRGLADWVSARTAEHLEAARTIGSPWRRQPRDAAWTEPPAPSVADEPGSPVVSVVVRSGVDEAALLAAIRTVVAQSLASWEIVLVDAGHVEDLEQSVRDAVGAHPVRRVAAAGLKDATALNQALALSEGELVAFLEPGDTWDAHRLARLVATCREQDVAAAYDGLRCVRGNGSVRYADRPVEAAHLRHAGELDLARVLVRADALDALGGFDDSLPGAWAFDLTTRLVLAGSTVDVPVADVHRDERAHTSATRLPARHRPDPDHQGIDTWKDVVRNRLFVDWGRLAAADRVAGRVSVVVPTCSDWRMTTRCVASVHRDAVATGADVEVVVVGNGCGHLASAVLESLAERFAEVRVVHLPVNQGSALGNNLALEQVTGEVVVFVDNDTVVSPGWLAPLVERLGDPDVLAAQPLLCLPTGTIRSAGVVFPDCGGLPHEFLSGFPVEDAAGVDELSFHALTGDALAVRTADVVALRGFDPVLGDGMGDVDLCLRLAELREGRFSVVERSRVTHHGVRTPGRSSGALTSRAVYLGRWADRAPRDDGEKWGAMGFEVTGHEVRDVVSEQRRLCVPEPVLRRTARWTVDGRPVLRWAIKNPAPRDTGAAWGDTYFAMRLADALRSIGQEVVVDTREEFYRESGRLDDVVVALRGLQQYHPSYGQVSLGWVISHPEMVSWAEARSYDRLFAASESWSAKMSKEWGIRIDPLLQATDPQRFHPDRAEPDTGHPVLFVGGSRRQFRVMVRHAVSLGMPLTVIGSDWADFIDGSYVAADWIDNEQLGAAYRSAGIVLNDHWDDMRDEGFVSNRLFDAVASGARVVSDDVAGHEGLFGRSVQIARSAEELSRIASCQDLDAIFGDDAERRAVAERVGREHSFVARAEQLLEAALELRQR